MVMTVGVLPIGTVEKTSLLPIKNGLGNVFPKTTSHIIQEHLPLSENSYDKSRGQYRSNQILTAIQSYAAKHGFSRFLGVLNVDIFVTGLNFVFGEAAFPGKTALISLWRLRPEFYKESQNKEVFAQRMLKEAVHEIGHTLGLKHCSKSSCVMHFSNSISETDEKRSLLCDECYIQAAISIDCLE